MEEYTEKLKAQGYTNVRQVTNITWEDLEDIGILKLGHQKKFLLAIKRIEDILSGKRIHASGSQNPYHSVMVLIIILINIYSLYSSVNILMFVHNEC